MIAETPRRSRRWLEVALYVGNALAALVILTLVLRLWRMDWRIPLSFGGDAAFTGAGVKGMIENGWFWINPHLGAPGVQNLLDYPGADLAFWIPLKLISLVTRDWAVTVNLFFILGFPVASVAALWSFRRLGLATATAFAMSLLYTFLPYHFLRGESHLFLGAYFMVPLVLVLCVELFGPAAPLVFASDAEKPRLDLKSRSAWLAIGICVLLGSSGIYYAYFACFFILLAALLGWWRSRERIRVLVGALLIGVVVATVVVNLSPFVIYRRQAGPNTAGVDRGIAGAELYALRPALLVLPVRNHRVGVLAYVHFGYSHLLAEISPTLDNEADFETLGIIGTVGFALLLLVLIFGLRPNPPPASEQQQRLSGVAALTGAAVLLASSGGFGTIIGVVMPQIRAYNRIVVFIAFLSLFGAGALVDGLCGKLSEGSRRWALPAVAVVLVLVGVFDQTTNAMVPDYAATKASWTTVSTFVGSIESGLTDGAKVLQLPYVPFPENPPVFGMVDYDHFKPYLVSTKVHWSYGAVKGRPDAAWIAGVSALPAPQMVAAIRQKGFVGVWVDRAGYADHGAAVVQSLAQATGVRAQSSSDGRYEYFAIGQ